MSLETQASVRRMKTFNLNGDEWDATRIATAGRWKRHAGVANGSAVSYRARPCSQIEPGSRLWPYHTHYLNEEW